MADAGKVEDTPLADTATMAHTADTPKADTPNMNDNTPPQPAYFPTSDTSPLHPPTALYTTLRSLPPTALTPTLTLLIPPRSARAWHVPAGSLFRLSTPAGPQVGDLNIWNAHDPRERFWAARTRQLQASHMTQGDRLWSNLPFMRPLAGIIHDDCLLADAPGASQDGSRQASRDARGALTKWGGRCHDLLGTRCDPYISRVISGHDYDFHCHSNLVRAVLPHGLTEFDVHDVLNVFQVTGLDAQGRYFMEPSPATQNSSLTFFAEQDLLCALSTCPGGDLSQWGWTQGDDGEEAMKSTCRPIRVEVLEINDKSVLDAWTRPQVSQYGGCHGMSIPGGEA